MEKSIHTERSTNHEDKTHDFGAGIIAPMSFNVNEHSVEVSHSGGNVTLTVKMHLEGAELHTGPFTLTERQFRNKVFFPLKGAGEVSVDNLESTVSKSTGKPLKLDLTLNSVNGKIGGAGL